MRLVPAANSVRIGVRHELLREHGRTCPPSRTGQSTWPLLRPLPLCPLLSPAHASKHAAMRVLANPAVAALVPTVAERSARSGPVAGPARPLQAASRAASLSSKEVSRDRVDMCCLVHVRSSGSDLPLRLHCRAGMPLRRGDSGLPLARRGDPEIQAAWPVFRERGRCRCFCWDPCQAH